ncbi:MAG TPA: nucleotidyltransferase domain-containing protein, partial [Candidatus Aenigmarchaeota archaeon]|nr:nucleotidyltransferase domain-containing protein [Candidatus Aenigmarchaeota archaeon]
MLSKRFYEKIKKDLNFLREYNVVLYGSILTPYFSERSDIDVCVITMNRDRDYNRRLWLSLLAKNKGSYDIRIFEFMPLFLKMEIIKNHKVLFGNKLEISEYFYFYRKIWKDMETRVERNRIKSVKEIKEGRKRLALLKQIK